MHLTPDIATQLKLKRWSGYLVTATGVLSLLVIAGWQFDIPWMRRPILHLPSMNPATAIAFLLASISFFLLYRYNSIIQLRMVGITCGGLVLAIGILKVIHAFSSIDIPVDNLLYTDKLGQDIFENIPNRMAPNTAIAFVLTGVCLLALYAKQVRSRIPVPLIAILMMLISLLAILGYLYNVKTFYGIFSYIPMAVHTAFCFLLFSVAFLFYEPGSPVMKEFTSVYSGSNTSRFLLLAAVLIPALLGLLRLYGQNTNSYSIEFGVTILVLSIIIAFLILIWYNTYRLNRKDILREKTETQLNNLGQLVEQTSDAILSTDTNLVIKSWNNAAKQMYGYSADEAIGKGVSELLKTKPTENKYERSMDSFRVEDFSKGEYQASTKEGQTLNILASISTLKNEYGTITGYVAVHRDITEIKEVEKFKEQFSKELAKQVKEKTELINSIVGRIRDGFCSFDNKWKFTYVNEYAARIMGSTMDNLLGKNLWVEYPDAMASPIFQLFKEAVELQKQKELEFYYEPNEKWFMVHAYPSTSGLSVFFRDTTEIKIAEREIKRSNERFHLISQTTNDAIWECDLETKEMWGNATHQHLYGLTVADPMPDEKEWQNRIHPDDRQTMIKKQEDALASDANVFITEYRFRTEKDGYRNIYDRCYIVRNDAGKAIRILGSMMDITERKIAEERLKRREIQLLGSLENTPNVAIQWYNEKGEILFWNRASELIFGWDSSSAIGKTLDKLIHTKEEAEAFAQTLYEVGKTGRTVGPSEYSFHRKDGSIGYCLATIFSIPSIDGQQCFVCMDVDITEQKKSEELLRKSEEVYRILVENAVEALVVLDVEKKKFISVSESAAQLFKISKEELLKMGPIEVSPEYQPDGMLSSESAVEKIEAAINGEKPAFEWMHCDAEGNEILCEVRLVRLPAEKQVLIRGSIIDITERKKIEQAIRASEETQRLIMNSALDAIVCADSQGVIIIWTPQAERIFGWSEQEALGRQLTDTIIPERYRERHLKGMERYRKMKEGRVLNKVIEIEAIKKNGEEFPIELTITPVLQGGSEFFCAFIRDITERKEAAEIIIKEKELSDTAINSLPGIFYMLDIDRKFLKWNKNFETVSGYPPEELAGIAPPLFFAEEDRPLVRQKVDEIFRLGSAELEARFLTKRGEKIPYFLTGKAITYEGRQCMIGTGIDIALLKKVQEDYSVLVNTIEGIVWEADANTFQFSFVSMQAEKLLGYPIARWIEEPSFWADHIHPDDRNWAVDYCVNSTKEMKAHEFEYRMIAADGRVVWLRDIVSVTVENGKPLRLRGIMVDITERKKGEISLQQSEEKLRHILSSTADDFYVIDKDYRVVLVNASAQKNFELLYGKKVTTGTYMPDIFPEFRKDFVISNYKKVFTGERIEYEISVNPANEIMWRRVNYSPVRNEKGEITGAYITTSDITERKKTEEEIIKTNARFQVMSKATSDIIWDWDLKSNSLWWNDNYYSTLGYNKEKEIVNIEDWYSKIHPEDFVRVKTTILASQESTDSVWRDEYRYAKSDGTFLNVLDRGYIMRDSNGRAYRMIGSMVDMTPIYLVQKKIAESENRLRTILDTDPECIMLLNMDCTLEDINKAGQEMVEVDNLEQVLGKSILALVGDNQKQDISQIVSDAFNERSGRVEFEMITLKGTKRWCDVSIVPFRNADGEIVNALGVARDVTEKKHAEIELMRNEEKYRTLVEQAADAIALFDASGRLLDVNTGSISLLGYSKEELKQMSLKDVLTEEEININPVRYDVLQEGKSTVKQRKMRRKDGTVVETEVRSQQLPDGRFLSVIRDLTERIRTEKELAASFDAIRKLTSHIQNVREEERTSIAREIHDELGQQLTVLKMDVSWLKRKIGSPDEAIQDKIKDLLTMLDETVRTVRRISSELRPSLLDDLGLLAAMEWHLKEFEQRSGLKTLLKTKGSSVDLPDNVKTGLFRIFQESLTNVARHAEANKVEVLLENNSNEIKMCITDDGKGFDRETTENKRTLGILGMKERTEMMGGAYEIDSKPGKGTTVIVKVTVQARLAPSVTSNSL